MSRVPDPSPDPLAAELSRWTAPPGLQGPTPGEVWRRIAVSESGTPNPLAAALELLGRPAWALVFVAACVIGGVLVAEVQVGRNQQKANEQLARSYLRLIDPLLQNGPKEGPS